MAELDLDAARAARAEALGEPKWVLLGGEKYELPAELPWDYFEVLADGAMKDAVAMILGDQFDRFWANNRISHEDLRAFAKGVPPLYGFGSPGESSASGGSSAPTGNPSKPTSPATTKSTSAKRSTARKPSGSAGSAP